MPEKEMEEQPKEQTKCCPLLSMVGTYKGDVRAPVEPDVKCLKKRCAWYLASFKEERNNRIIFEFAGGCAIREMAADRLRKFGE